MSPVKQRYYAGLPTLAFAGLALIVLVLGLMFVVDQFRTLVHESELSEVLYVEE